MKCGRQDRSETDHECRPINLEDSRHGTASLGRITTAQKSAPPGAAEAHRTAPPRWTWTNPEALVEVAREEVVGRCDHRARWRPYQSLSFVTAARS